MMSQIFAGLAAVPYLILLISILILSGLMWTFYRSMTIHGGAHVSGDRLLTMRSSLQDIRNILSGEPESAGTSRIHRPDQDFKNRILVLHRLGLSVEEISDHVNLPQADAKLLIKFAGIQSQFFPQNDSSARELNNGSIVAI